ncbi:MAG: TIR domain-containing protein [Candidatus Binatia bacterium]
MNIFISHASQDTPLCVQIERVLEKDGHEVWLDRSDIRLGVLLRAELQSAIRKSGAVVLVWSKAAAASRWVAAEILTAFHLRRFIVPCVVDTTPLPQFLDNTVYLNFLANAKTSLRSLSRAITEVPRAANSFSKVMSSQSPDLQDMVQQIAQKQDVELARLGQRDLTGAREMHALVDVTMKKAEKRWRWELTVLNLAGYHRKNAYMLKHWDAIQAGRPPKDPLLRRAEQFFFEALFVDPTDCSALNGLGSILILERELEAAEFFIRRALTIAKKKKLSYTAAEHDLALIRHYKTQV